MHMVWIWCESDLACIQELKTSVRGVRNLHLPSVFRNLMQPVPKLSEAKRQRALDYVNSLNGRGYLKSFGQKIGVTSTYLSSLRTGAKPMTASLAAKVLAQIPTSWQKPVPRPVRDISTYPIPSPTELDAMFGCNVGDCRIDGFSWAAMWREWYRWMDFHFPQFAAATVAIIGGKTVCGTARDSVTVEILYEETHRGKRRHCVWTLGIEGCGDFQKHLGRSRWNTPPRRELPAARLPLLPSIVPAAPGN